jgi:DNA-binding SARP family transcriptional activator
MISFIPNPQSWEQATFSPSSLRHPSALLPNEPNIGEAGWTIFCLGRFQVYQSQQRVEKWSSHKSKSIFKYMIAQRERPIHSEVLMELFWPEVESEAARRNLHQAIYTLRKTLPKGRLNPILFEDDCYRLNPHLEVWVDAEIFLAHYQAGQRLERADCLSEAIREYQAAASLYQGDFLIEDIYEDWSTLPRQNLKQAYLDVLDRLSQYYLAQEDVESCVALCQKLVHEDNCHEEAHQRLMYCYLRQGQRHLALRQYQLCLEALAQELNLAPLPATVTLYQQIQENRAL